MFDENTGTISQDKGKSATKIDMVLYENGVASANLWASNALGTIITTANVGGLQQIAMSNTHTWEAANSLLLVLIGASTNTTGPANEYMMGAAYSSYSYPRYAIRGQPQFADPSLDFDSYAHDNVNAFAVNTNQGSYDRTWRLFAGKFEDGTLAAVSNTDVGWQETTGTALDYPTTTANNPNRYGIGTLPNSVPYSAPANFKVLAAMVYINNYAAWDNAFMSSLYSDPWQFLTTSSPPTFTVAPTVTSKTNTSYTASFTPNQSCNAFAVAVLAGSTAPSIAQIKAGQDGNGNTAKASANKAVSVADTLVLTVSDNPAFPRYDLYFVLNSAGGDSSRITLASQYLNPPTGKAFSTLASVDPTSPFFGTGADVADTVVIDQVTTPDSYPVVCADDGTVSYNSGGVEFRQFIDVNVYDYSVGAYFGAGTLVFNNYGPSGTAFNEPLLYQKDITLDPVDLTVYVPDPEGDPVTVTALDALPSGLSVSTSILSGTPTVYGSTDTQIQWMDLYGSTYVETVTIQVGDRVPNVVGNIQATAISTITGIASLTTNIIEESSPTVPSGYVISTDPVAGRLVQYNSVVNVYVANGTTVTMTTLALPEGLRNGGYTGQLTADGEVTSWYMVSGILPTGLSLNGTSGEISGIPTVAGTFVFTVGCTNGVSSDTQSLSIKILYGQTTTPGSIPSITVDPPTNEAIAVVGNVSQGSIEGLYVTFPGYGYRTFSNTQVTVYRSIGDDPSANQSTDIRVTGITTANAFTNTNARFVETIIVDKMPIGYASDLTLSNTGDWALFSSNVRNVSVTLNGTPGSGTDKWHQFEDWYADSNGSFETANITGKILTANTGWTGGPATVAFYAVANSKPLTILVGNLISTVTSTQNYTIDAVLDTQMDVNANSAICSALSFVPIETGGISLYNIINGGYGFRTTPTVETKSYRDTYLSENYAYGTPEHANTQQIINSTGQIAHVYVSAGGSGYANGDAIIVGGSGYGFTGNVIVGANGAIVGTTISNRGEGYYGSISASVTSANGINASLTPYGFGEGVSVGIETGAIGRVKDIRMIYRGSGYTITPIISLKVVDMIIDGIADNESINEGDRVYQGDTLATASFQGIVKSYNRSDNLLRLFNYSGNSFESFQPSIAFTSTRGVIFSVNTAAKVPAPDAYPEAVKATGLPNPWFYGNGKAKGVADFYNGLIKFNGFYINTDGFLSSDKKIQDEKTYHNYSYVVESEKSLSQYAASMKDIVHPIGMIMLGRTISKSELAETIVSDSISSTIPFVNANATVHVSNSYNKVVTGSNTLFDSTASIGDMLLIEDTVHPLRSQAKTITFIESEDSLRVESNFIYVGQGRLTTNANNATVYITGNTNAIGDFISTGDTVRINVGNVETYQVTVGSGNTLTLNNNANTTNSTLVYQVVPDFTSETAYTIIKVTE
jgi:hypothetical protein